MHEMGLAEGILEVALSIAGDRPVRRVAVSAGEHLVVSADSLEFSFQLICDGTAAAGATLETRTVAGDRLLVDEVEVGGESSEVIRRTDAEVIEPAHDDPHQHIDAPIHPAWL